jgi:hypothetical protein
VVDQDISKIALRAGITKEQAALVVEVVKEGQIKILGFNHSPEHSTRPNNRVRDGFLEYRVEIPESEPRGAEIIRNARLTKQCVMCGHDNHEGKSCRAETYEFEDGQVAYESAHFGPVKPCGCGG